MAVAGDQAVASCPAATLREAAARGLRRASRHPFLQESAPSRRAPAQARREEGRGGGLSPRFPPFSRLARAAALLASCSGGGAEGKASRMRRGAARCPPAPSRQPRRPRGPGQGRGRRPEPR